MSRNKTRLALALIALMGSSATVHAATAAGTIISNSIDFSYSSGGTTITRTNQAVTSFMVDRKVDNTFVDTDADDIVFGEPGSETVALTFRLENTGNGPSDYDINVVAGGSAGALTLSPIATTTLGQYYVVISDNATPGAGTETIYNPTGTINAASLAADAVRWVHIYGNLPLTAVSAQTFTFTVSSTALQPGTTDAFVDDGTGDLATLDTVLVGGSATRTAALQTMRINAPMLSATKTVRVLHNGIGAYTCASGPDGGATDLEALPGACLLYTITLANDISATAAATDIELTDVLPAEVDLVNYQVGTFDTIDDDGDRTVTAEKASIAAGASASFTIRAQIPN